MSMLPNEPTILNTTLTVHSIPTSKSVKVNSEGVEFTDAEDIIYNSTFKTQSWNQTIFLLNFNQKPLIMATSSLEYKTSYDA
jgi:hypothetical protein